jgi:hypothetical protein
MNETRIPLCFIRATLLGSVHSTLAAPAINR